MIVERYQICNADWGYWGTFLNSNNPDPSPPKAPWWRTPGITLTAFPGQPANPVTATSVPFQTGPKLTGAATDDTVCNWATPNTPHTAMVVALADASVRSLSRNMALANFQGAVRPDDGQTLEE